MKRNQDNSTIASTDRGRGARELGLVELDVARVEDGETIHVCVIALIRGLSLDKTAQELDGVVGQLKIIRELVSGLGGIVVDAGDINNLSLFCSSSTQLLFAVTSQVVADRVMIVR